MITFKFMPNVLLVFVSNVTSKLFLHNTNTEEGTVELF